MDIKLLSYNIRFSGAGREKLIAGLIRTLSPDLVVFQEATNPSVIKRISEETEMNFLAAREDHSIAYISRIKIEHQEWHHPIGSKHAFMEIVPSGIDLRIFGLHLKARFSKWSERRRAQEIRLLLEGIKSHQNGFHILVGDFNTLAPGELLDVRRMPAWIRVLVWLSGRDIQRETIRHMLEAGYTDIYRHLNPENKGYTFPTWDPHLRLDYAFTPSRYTNLITSCISVNYLNEARSASDHFPLLVQIKIDG